MIFNTASYFLLFLIPAAILFRIVGPALRPWVCVASGCAFFAYFSASSTAGWAGVACLAIFAWEAFVSRLYRERSAWCFFGVVFSVAILCAFKYWNFATGIVGADQLRWSGAFLPLGISFFTFEFIHYAVDRYRGRVEKGTLGEYLAFIFFFPTMVAGPIKRFQDFLPCLRSPSHDWVGDWNRGITRILAGLAKKFAIADFLTSLTDNLNASEIARADRWALPLWLLAYGWKIYFDFSAYSDIAIGSGRLFGIRIPENFDWPYFRTDIASFWRHWHISLYKWLIDYIFIPIGGSRAPVFVVYRNLLVVMLVSGIWHGAGLNYLAWGLWHGILLAVHRAWSRRAGAPRIGDDGPTWHGRLTSWALTYVAVNLGWALFAMDLPTAVLFYRRLLLG